MSQWYLRTCEITRVQYTYNPDKGKELGFGEFRYFWQQVGGMQGESVVYCTSKTCLETLVKYWNSQQPDRWKYWVD